MEAGWPSRAAFRWFSYAVLWTIAVAAGLLSDFHPVILVAGAASGCMVAASLPLIFATLFEDAYGRWARRDLPFVFCPLLGALVILSGVAALFHASPLVARELTAVHVDDAYDLLDRYGTVAESDLPRAICIGNAFIKTDWEDGKLQCQESRGHIACTPTYVAAPLFNDKAEADVGLADEIQAWAVSYGRHVSAPYQADGSICGYMSGFSTLDFYISAYRTAIVDVIDHYQLSLKPGNVGAIPLQDRPMIMTADMSKMFYQERTWLFGAFVFLCLCPCAGPIPLAVVFIFFGWTTKDRYCGRHAVATDDLDAEMDGVLNPMIGNGGL